MIRLIKKIIIGSIVTINLTCSYVSDYIEGVITNRSSFSITAQYISGIGVIIEWKTTPNEDTFAGYEIYMSVEPNNEFADMIVVAARYIISSNQYFQYSEDLSNPSTSMFIHTIILPPGVYFYRVGIIDWSERDYNGDGKDEKKPINPNETLYQSHTFVSKISGSAMVEIL